MRQGPPGHALGLCMTFVILAGCTDASAPSRTSEPEEPPEVMAHLPNFVPEQRILFAADTDGEWDFYGGDADIFSMAPDGRDIVNLTDHPANDYSPEWSPDGSEIAFRTDRDGDHEIYVMNADGSGATNVSRSQGEERSPAWSPDGQRIAFSSDREGDRDIFVMDADGSNVRRLAGPGTDEYPTWSPDGNRIAFASACSSCATFELWVMRADGSHRRQLADVVNAGWPDWSPDGRFIAFDSPTDDGTSRGTFIIRPRPGATPRFVGRGLQPDWAPDAEKLVVLRGGPIHEGPIGDDQVFRGEIEVVRLDGTERERVTDTRPIFEFEPSWSPLIPTPTKPPFLSTNPMVVRNRYITGRPLFSYDSEFPLDVVDTGEVVHGTEMRYITYSSPLGGRVPAILGEPTGDEPHPAVILMHGMPSEALDMAERMQGLLEAGVAVIAIDAPFTRPENDGRVEGPTTFTPLDRAEQIQLIVDLRRAYDVLVEEADVDPHRVGYFGVSYGAAMGSLLAGVERRIAAFSLAVGDGGLVSHFTGLGLQTRALKDLPRPRRLEWLAAMEPIEPIYFIGRARSPIFMQSARQDEAVPLIDSRAWWDAAPRASKRVYTSGHILPIEAECHQARFLHRHLRFPNGIGDLCPDWMK